MNCETLNIVSVRAGLPAFSPSLVFKQIQISIFLENLIKPKYDERQIKSLED